MSLNAATPAIVVRSSKAAKRDFPAPLKASHSRFSLSSSRTEGGLSGEGPRPPPPPLPPRHDVDLRSLSAARQAAAASAAERRGEDDAAKEEDGEDPPPNPAEEEEGAREEEDGEEEGHEEWKEGKREARSQKTPRHRRSHFSTQLQFK